MNPRLSFAALLIVLLALVSVFRVSGCKESAAQSVSKPADLVARGKYLVTVGACTDCHSPHDEKGQVIAGREFSGHPENAPLPQWDPSMMEKGVVTTIAPPLTAFAGPFGVSVATNLTPDMETGMGVLSAEGFVDSWKTGRHWKGLRPVLPPMPIDSYKHFTEEDMRAIFAYLRSLPPIKNRTPESVVNMPPPGEAAAAPASK